MNSIPIRDLTDGMKSVNLVFIVLDIGAPQRTKDNSEIRVVRIADKSASVNLSVWNQLGALLQPGDICRLVNGYTNVHKGRLGVICGKRSELVKTGEFCMHFSELPDMSAFIDVSSNAEPASQISDDARPITIDDSPSPSAVRPQQKTGANGSATRRDNGSAGLPASAQPSATPPVESGAALPRQQRGGATARR